MKRTVYECHFCGGEKHPCRVINISEGSLEVHAHVCPFDKKAPCEWQKVSECEIPDDEDENTERKE